MELSRRDRIILSAAVAIVLGLVDSGPDAAMMVGKLKRRKEIVSGLGLLSSTPTTLQDGDDLDAIDDASAKTLDANLRRLAEIGRQFLDLIE